MQQPGGLLLAGQDPSHPAEAVFSVAKSLHLMKNKK
jgi:hypothetical protein